MAKTQRNKATEGHLCRLRAQHAKLSRELIANTTKSSGGGEGFDVKKGGNATVGFVGFPSVGKSSLLNALTGREISEAAAYEFTTLTAQSSIIKINGSKVQFLDFLVFWKMPTKVMVEVDKLLLPTETVIFYTLSWIFQSL